LATKTKDFQVKNGLLVAGTTDSSSSITGAVRISGGVGIAKKLYVGTDLTCGTLNVSGNSISAANAEYITIGTHTGTVLFDLGIGATISTADKTFNIGLNGLSGSDTRFHFGATASGAFNDFYFGGASATNTYTFYDDIGVSGDVYCEGWNIDGLAAASSSNFFIQDGNADSSIMTSTYIATDDMRAVSIVMGVY
jgi:hypothetical protein